MIIRNENCILEAHRGVSNEYPENTIAAYRAAVDLGYGMIELDARFTMDNRCVMMHDRTLSRTTRLPDGSTHSENIPISSVSFDFVRTLDAGLHKGDRFRGEAVPSLEEVILLSQQSGVPLKFDNILMSYTPEQLAIFFDTLENLHAWNHAGFTVNTPSFAQKILERCTSAVIHYDGPLTEDNLNMLSSVVPYNQLYIWGRFDNRITSWCKTPPVTPETAQRIHEIGQLGIWLLTERDEYDFAVHTLHADVVETDGRLRP